MKATGAAGAGRGPMVSIVLPTRNSRRFLGERVRTILDQTLTDWELIVVDSFSADGTWEYLNEMSRDDVRWHLHQVPPGLYESWNFGLEKACGKYVYIATSDDLMRADCLEKMTAVLERHPECGICSSRLRVVDAKSEAVPDLAELYMNAAYWGEWLEIPHIRLAPHDGVMHLLGGTVYTSVTQILVRRELFDEVGLFPVEFGRMGDYAWGMTASLLHSTYYLPEELSSWRRHPAQVTPGHEMGQEYSRAFAMMLDMADYAIAGAIAQVSGLRRELPRRPQRILRLRWLIESWSEKHSWYGRLHATARALIAHPRLVVGLVVAKGLQKVRLLPASFSYSGLQMRRFMMPYRRVCLQQVGKGY